MSYDFWIKCFQIQVIGIYLYYQKIMHIIKSTASYTIKSQSGLGKKISIVELEFVDELIILNL